MNPAQLETCRTLNLDPRVVSFSSREATNCRISVSVEGAPKPIPYYVVTDGGGIHLEDAPAQRGAPAKVSEEHGQDDQWQLNPVLRDVAKEVDTAADRIREVAASFGHRIPVHVADAIVKEFESGHEVDPTLIITRTIRIIASELIRPKTNLRVRAWALAFAAELECAEGKSMTSLADELSHVKTCPNCKLSTKTTITKASISKEKISWQKRLGLPDSRYGKSDQARESYRKHRKENHWRHDN